MYFSRVRFERCWYSLTNILSAFSTNLRFVYRVLHGVNENKSHNNNNNNGYDNDTNNLIDFDLRDVESCDVFETYLATRIPLIDKSVCVRVCAREPMRENKKEWHSWLANIKPTTKCDCDTLATATAAITTTVAIVIDAAAAAVQLTHACNYGHFFCPFRRHPKWSQTEKSKWLIS